MTHAQPPSKPLPDEESLVDEARREAQARVADLHVEEGTVDSEKGKTSPHPDDHD